MMPIMEPIKVRTVTIQALEPRFYTTGGQIARVGELYKGIALADARDLARRGVALIVEGSERLTSTEILVTDPPVRSRKWMEW